MMKFIKSHMASMTDIEWYPIISLVIFFSFFTIMTIRVIAMRKEKFDEQSNLPLED